MALLEVQGLCVRKGRQRIVGPLDLELEAGERRALVGPSGAGKSLTAAAVLGTLPASLSATGSIRWNGREILGRRLSSAEHGVRAGLGFVSQDPQRSLHPQTRAGRQLESAFGHAHARRPSAEALDLLSELAFDDPEAAWHALPHELSGGQCQRICLGLALAQRPRLLLADEPTTALDTVTQHQVLRLIDRLLPSSSSLLLITHDLSAARVVGAELVQMAGGRLVAGDQEQPPAPIVRAQPRKTIVRVPAEGATAPSVVAVRNLTVRHAGARKRPPRTALENVSLSLAAGDRIGLVGASGAGKSTLIHSILGLQRPSAGSVRWMGREVESLTGPTLREFRRRVQLVPQSARASLSPRASAVGQVAEPLRLLADRTAQPQTLQRSAEEMLDRVGLPQKHWGSRPRELSGGQCQRVAIARALATGPDLLIADEPLSGIDPASRRGLEVLLDEVLAAPQAEAPRNPSTSQSRATPPGLLLISHDLDSVARLCDRAVVLDAGRIVADSPVTDLLEHPESEIAARLVEAHCLPVQPAA